MKTTKRKPGSRKGAAAVTMTYFADGSLDSAGRYLDGKRHGPWKFYLRNGKLALGQKL